MKKKYICGPMTGLPEYNYPAFDKAAAQLRAEGHTVESPAENTPPECGTWAGWLRITIRQLLNCDTIVLLPGWRRSRGARLELYIAKALGMNIERFERITT